MHLFVSLDKKNCHWLERKCVPWWITNNNALFLTNFENNAFSTALRILSSFALKKRTVTKSAKHNYTTPINHHSPMLASNFDL